MKRVLPLLAVFIISILPVRAQLVSYDLQESFTASQLDSFLTTTGFNLPVSPQYAIDVYHVIYKTPYRHIDSLVNVSGIIVFPKNALCPSALGCYAHGTFTRRDQVPSYNGPERPIGFFFAGIGGVVTAMPDELGLGDCDSSVIIHPYISAFHSGYASVNIMRAARQLADTLGVALSGEVALTGYSEGGYITMATNKLIQENFSSEFNIIASAPMSGPYDLNKTMVDVMLSPAPFPAPSYLPYVLLGYYSIYPQLQQTYPSISDIFKSPYDTVLPPLYYSKNFSTGDIDQFCSSSPISMIKDSVVAAFASDSLHPFRQLLAQNDLLGWAPQNPVKIHYCTGDQQVNYLNGVRADSAWVANGAPNVIAENFGNLDHGPCVEPALTSAALYILGKISTCSSVPEQPAIAFKIAPNPSTGYLNLIKEEGLYTLNIFNTNGQLLYTTSLINDIHALDLSQLPKGFYDVELRTAEGKTAHKKLVLQ